MIGSDLKIYTIGFFGHRHLHDIRPVDVALLPILRELIQTKQHISFFIGRNGEFDEYVASIIKRLQKELGNDNSEMVLVLPYSVSDIDYYEKYYDSIIIPDTLSKVHPKAAITLRNRWIIDRSDLVIVNVEHKGGGAYEAMKYAKNKGKKIINLCKHF